MNFRQTLSFDDVLLVPKDSSISSREEVNISTFLGKLEFRLPVVSSPMDTVTESQMAIQMFRQGGLGIIHRYNTTKDQVKIVLSVRDSLEETSNAKISSIAAAVGVSEDLVSRSRSLYNAGARVFCVDIAHGHHSLMEAALKTLKDMFAESVTLIAGNVATAQGYLDLSDWGADAVRMGIGGGSICSTRIQTGHGVPTFQSILDCRDCDGASLIADGGIKTTGDIVKSLAAGADMVMLGSMLAGTLESPGNIFQSKDNKRYKVYRGMASPEAQIAWRGNARSLEGISTTIPYKGEVEKILSDMSQNIKSGFSYTGARSIRELQARAEFIRQSASGLKESQTHILLK